MSALAVNAFSIVCVVSASYMAVQGTPGWGWFLFIGVIAVRVPSVTTNDSGAEL